MELTYDEIVDVLHLNYLAGSSTGYTLRGGIFESSDNNLMLNFLLPDEVKLKFTIDDIRLKSNLTTNKTIRFTKRSSFYTILGFIKSHSGVLGDFSGCVQLIPGSYKNDNPFNITGSDNNSFKMRLL